MKLEPPGTSEPRTSCAKVTGDGSTDSPNIVPARMLVGSPLCDMVFWLGTRKLTTRAGVPSKCALFVLAPPYSNATEGSSSPNAHRLLSVPRGPLVECHRLRNRAALDVWSFPPDSVVEEPGEGSRCGSADTLACANYSRSSFARGVCGTNRSIRPRDSRHGKIPCKLSRRYISLCLFRFFADVCRFCRIQEPLGNTSARCAAP